MSGNRAAALVDRGRLSLFSEELKTPLQIVACVSSGGWEFHSGWGFRVNKQCGGLRGWRGPGLLPGVRPSLLLL